MGTVVDPLLIQKYDSNGPRYTSYPTAASFTDSYNVSSYEQAAQDSNEDPIPKQLSLYVHIPFCDTICFYCACNKIATKNHAMATEYLQRLYKEIEMQAQLFDDDRLVSQLHWGGGTPTFLSSQQMAELMDVIMQHFQLATPDVGEFSIEIDPRSVTDKTIHALGQLGFNRFSLGVQDINPVVQKAVNRIQLMEMNERILAACRAAGARSVNIDLIYGLPHQTMKGFSSTLDAVIELSPDRLSVFNYAHMPTRFKPQRRINEADLPTATVKLNILQLTIEKLTSAGYVNIGMDHFAKPDDELCIAQRNGSLHRNFQGYTTRGGCDLVGLGASAIGSVCASYSQNARDLATYNHLIDAGKLPVVKGITLSIEDRLRRKIIQQLICHFKLSFSWVERDYAIDFIRFFHLEMAALEPLMRDGLVAIAEREITVLNKGRLLIRNICMVFDAHSGMTDQKAQFSRLV